MITRFRATSLVVILASAAPGCGSSATTPPPGPINPTAASDHRIKMEFKEEYKHAFGKDGKIIKNPYLKKKQQPSDSGTSKP